ncbi:signal peptide peptidase SppA [Halomontanus rarus]|uniref:signal peptide peptidase SppA n=1 Tax=Halomontanus rarus TaxID=3034020 RepID=UPI00307C88C3
MSTTPKQIAGAVLGAALGVGVGYYVAVYAPNAFDLSIWTSVIIANAAVGGALGGFMAVKEYGNDLDIAAVDVHGAIERNPGAFDAANSADEYVDAVELADEDDAEGLLVRINSPGGEVGPSEQIRSEIEGFDGPTVALAEDTCASGGYLIASACDHIIAHDHSLVGSIGVVGSRPNVSSWADEQGVDYQQFTAGEYKDAGHPLKDPDDSDEEYLQGLIDSFYETFCARVADSRDLELEDVKATEARVFIGGEALENELIDAIGTEDDAREWLATQLERDDSEDLEVFTYESSKSLADTLSPSAAAQKVAYAFGAGIAGRLSSNRLPKLEYRYK